MLKSNSLTKSKSLGMITKSINTTPKAVATSPAGQLSAGRLSQAYSDSPLSASSSSQSLILTSLSPRTSLGILSVRVYDEIDAGAPMPSLNREVREAVLSADNKPDLADYELPFVLDLNDDEEQDEDARLTLRR